MKLAIPGIPFPLGSDFTGDQRHDTGAHLTVWSQPGSAGNGSPYTPPDLTTALQIEGQEFTFTLLPPEEGLKILVASESNDMNMKISIMEYSTDQSTSPESGVMKHKELTLQ